MAEENATQTPGDAPNQGDAPQFGIERIYLKDVSLEAPKRLDPSKAWQPKVKLDLNTQQQKMDDTHYEVVLHMTVTATEKDSEATYFLIEIQQAGLFLVKNLPEQDAQRLLGTVAPTTLFPYAREAIDGLAVKANFPPLRLSPINFDALWQNALAQAQAENAKAGSDTVQ